MNFFQKYRYIVWVLILLVVINVAALVSFFLFAKTGSSEPCCPPQEKQVRSFSNELGLSAAQTEKVTLINQNYKAQAEPIAAEIKKTRGAILNELEQDQPDTSLLNKLSQEFSILQKNIQQENIRQYLELKKVCNEDQIQRLSALYRDLYDCPMQANAMKHKLRHGQGKSKGQARCE